MTIFYDLLQSSKKDLLKDANYVIHLYRINVTSGLLDVPPFLLCFTSVPTKIPSKLGNCYLLLQSIASWLVFPPNSSWTGNSTLLQNTKTLLDLLNLWRRIFLPRPLTLDTLAPFIKEKNNPISATNEDPDWIGSHRFVRFRY